MILLTFPIPDYRLQARFFQPSDRCFSRDTPFHYCYNLVAVGTLPNTYMPILETASVQDLKRLLELFPVTSLRQRWPEIKGTKDELCFEVAGRRRFDEIVEFIDYNLSCCRQHAYVFSHELDPENLPVLDIPDGERVYQAQDERGRVRALYVIRFRYTVVLRDPLEEATLEFLWPVRLDLARGNLIVRFVTLEKNIGSYYEGRQYYLDRRSLEEKGVLRSVLESFGGGLRPTDLHKGVKELWGSGFMDSPRVRYKKSVSTASEAMDEDRGIREDNPDLYAALAESPLFNTLFYVAPEAELSVTAFSVDPSDGRITFPRYSERPGDTDRVVDEILRHNQ